MSDYSGCSRGSCRGNRSRDGKPNYVKRLNFGQSILELDVLQRPQQSSNRVLHGLDRNVTGIPCTGKEDYVRKWIEVHEDKEIGGRSCDPSKDASRLSPVLGTSKTNAQEESPVLGRSARRFKKWTRANKRAVTTAGSTGDANCQEQSARCTINCAVRCKLNYGNGEENGNKQEIERRREHVNKIQRTPSCTERIVTDKSCILSTRSSSPKKKRRKLWYDSKKDIPTKHLMLYENKSTNSHVDVIMDSDSDKVKEAILSIEEEESPERSETCAVLSRAQEKPNSDDSSSDNNKETPKIEDTSYDSKDKDCNESSSTNSNYNKSNIIEEVDTQDMIEETVQVKSLVISRPPNLSQQATNPSNETYCSEAEMMLNQSTERLSAKISGTPSGVLSRDTAGNKSTQTPVISTITTPSKTSLDKTVYARLYDSGGKRRYKPKK